MIASTCFFKHILLLGFCWLLKFVAICSAHPAYMQLVTHIKSPPRDVIFLSFQISLFLCIAELWSCLPRAPERMLSTISFYRMCFDCRVYPLYGIALIVQQKGVDQLSYAGCTHNCLLRECHKSQRPASLMTAGKHKMFPVIIRIFA